jgi:murein DD-endopeptidase MepM/ murein hydrolase activator NlpD
VRVMKRAMRWLAPGTLLVLGVWACGDGEGLNGPSAGDAQFPLKSWSVTQDFGIWNSNWGGYHLAEDAHAIAGHSVFAMADGVVREAFAGSQGYGAVMLIEHRFGDEYVVSLYGHVSTRRGFRVSIGESVSKGQLVAFIADDDEDGGAWGPHLHFGVREGRYSSDATICGLWLYVGYTRACSGMTHEEHRELWYDPGDFMTVHGG